MTNANETNATASQQLLGRIVSHLDGGVIVIVATSTRATRYDRRHVALFRASRNENEGGVYVRHGRRSDYVLPQYVRFAVVR